MATCSLLGRAVSRAGVKQFATLESALAAHASSQGADLLRLQSEVLALRPLLQLIPEVLVGLEARVLERLEGVSTQLHAPAPNPAVTGNPQELQVPPLLSAASVLTR
jgi:hypothetical protein